MSDANKIVAAILTHGFISGSGTRFDEKTWPEVYKRMLVSLGDSGGQSEPSAPEIKAAIIETLDRVLAKK